MIFFLLKTLYHILIAFTLYFSFKGIRNLVKNILKKNININYPIQLSLYFIISLFIFLINKNFQICLTLFLVFYFLKDNYKIKIKDDYFVFFVLIITFSLFNGKMIHEPTKEYAAWGLFDTYYYVSKIYFTDINSSLEVENLTIFNQSLSIFRNLIAILGYQFSFINVFDPFNFISISLPILSFLLLRNEINFFKKNSKYNNEDLAFYLLLVIFSLPYPLYFYESPPILAALPILPSLAKVFVDKELNILNIFIISFSILLTKIAMLSILVFILFTKLLRQKNKFLFIISLIFMAMIFHSIIPYNDVLFFFRSINFDILDLKLNYSGIHKVIQMIMILFLAYILKLNFKLFIFFPSVILFLFYPASSPGQLFFVLIIIVSLLFLKNDIFKPTIKINLKLNNKFIIYISILTSFLLGFIYSIHFFYYVFYLLFLLMITNPNLASSYKYLFHAVLFFILINTLFNMPFRSDDVVKYSQKVAYEKVKNFTEKNSLIFTDFHLPEKYSRNPAAPWGLYSSISERQFYLSTFHSDYLNKISRDDKLHIYKVNFNVINQKINPNEIFKNTKYKNFYILTQNISKKDKNLETVYQDQAFKILKFK